MHCLESLSNDGLTDEVFGFTDKEGFSLRPEAPGAKGRGRNKSKSALCTQFSAISA
jgi:hypothetical protein